MKAAAALLAGLFTCASWAGTIKGNPTNCRYLATSSELVYIASAFDNRTWEEVKPEVLIAMIQNRGHPDSYIKDDEDVRYVLEVFERVWRATDYEGLQEKVYKDCLRAAKLSV